MHSMVACLTHTGLVCNLVRAVARLYIVSSTQITIALLLELFVLAV